MKKKMNLLDSSMKIERPIPISMIAIFLLFGAFMSMKSIMEAAESGNTILWYYYFSLLIALLSLITAVGLLMMRRWAMYLYMTYIPISLFVQGNVQGFFNIYSMLFAAIFIIFMIKHKDKMQ